MISLDAKKGDFKRLIAKGQLSHAYLFFGGNNNDQAAKYDFALSLANFLESKVFEKSVKPLTELLSVNKEEGGIGITAAREIKRFLYQKPISSDFRTVIIREAEALTPDAQSAILKIIEEPPEAALIILITRNENSLFPTLTSRLQRIYFPHSCCEFKAQDIKRPEDFSLDEMAYDGRMDEYAESLMVYLMDSPIKNFDKLKEILRRLTAMKQFNTNKKLQLRVLNNKLKR